MYCCLQKSSLLSFFTQIIKSLKVLNLSLKTLFLFVDTEVPQASFNAGISDLAFIIMSFGHECSNASLIVE
jgi:hypothetical protein